jgi:hypothetical protein
MRLSEFEPKLEAAMHFRVSIGSRLVTTGPPQGHPSHYNPSEVLAPF